MSAPTKVSGRRTRTSSKSKDKRIKELADLALMLYQALLRAEVPLSIEVHDAVERLV